MRKIITTICLISMLLLFVPRTGFAQEEASQEYVIAVIDTGVDYTHPDLKDHMWINTTTLPGKHGYDFINQDEDPFDDFGHGTHCAGIIIQEAKRLGVRGEVKIMALKYMIETGSGDTAQDIEAYKYILEAKKQGVNIVAISNSWGTTDNPKELEDLVNEAGRQGILSVNAAGNFSDNLDVNKTFPAGYDSEYTLVVGASTRQGRLAYFFQLRQTHCARAGTRHEYQSPLF